MTQFEEFKSSTREDEIKAKFLTFLSVSLDMRYNIDCYTDNILFEFKYDKDIRSPDVLAQATYYLNALLKHGDKIPPYIALINIDEIAVFESSVVEPIYKRNSLFSNGSPSNPDAAVVNAVSKYINTLYFCASFDYEEEFVIALDSVKDLLNKKRIVAEKIKISNVKRAYNGYVRQLGDYILSQSSSSGVFEFRADAIGKAVIVADSPITNEYSIDFQFDNGAKRIENIDKSAYDSYWKQWKRITTDEEAIAVFKTIYDLLGISDRRTKGQFYTPHNLAKEAWNRIINELGDNFWESGNWRIWDCCAGTGNLEYDVIPDSCKQYMYLSTLDIEEVDTLKQKFPLNRCVFQYDFLDDHINKLPTMLKTDMADQNIKWLFLINPPYVEAQGKSSVQSGTTQSNLQDRMKYENLGDAAREMFSQFLYRIEKEFKNKYFLGLFSSVKFFTSKKFEGFRYFWTPEFKGGFVVNASEHFQCKGNWPLIFSLFDRTFRRQLELGVNPWMNQTFEYDIYDKNLNNVGTKKFKVFDKTKNFRLYFPDNPSSLTVRTPLLSSGIALSTGNTYCEPFAPHGFVATMVFIGGDFQQQNRCFLASGVVNTNHNNIYLTEENYKDVLIGFSLYKCPNSSWLNNKDFFSIPNRPLTDEEKMDCLLYSLISHFNNCATYRFADGSTIMNKLNPLDAQRFDFSQCSAVGKAAFQEAKLYLLNDVKYDQLNTLFGRGAFLGFYQYRTTPDSDHDQCYGIKYKTSFDNAIEELRKRIEQIALEVCF